ncbi:Set1/Ash2 histone methyltransferase complex subunit ASH2 [Sparganum proliferum]
MSTLSTTTGYPHERCLADILEGVQRRATKAVHGLKNFTYEQRLSALNLYPLHYRQDRGDLIATFQLVKGLNLDVDWETFFKMTPKSNLRRHDYQLKRELCHTNQRSSFFSQRVIRQWNSLPEFVVNSPTVSVFKRQLDIHLLKGKLNYRSLI